MNEPSVLSRVLRGHTLDLQEVPFFSPWDIATVMLAAIDLRRVLDAKILLPSISLRTYLRRMHLQEPLRLFGFSVIADELERIATAEHDNLRVQEIVHCRLRDEFDARLPRFVAMFQNFGLDEQAALEASAVIGELGNNSFDHNLGNWPESDITGCFVMGQAYPNLKKIVMVVADAGVGFRASLKVARPEIVSEEEAIRVGLAGITGRVGEARGNGLRFIQNLTVSRFHGILRIQSYDGVVTVDEKGAKGGFISSVSGTIAGIELYYN